MLNLSILNPNPNYLYNPNIHPNVNANSNPNATPYNMTSNPNTTPTNLTALLNLAKAYKKEQKYTGLKFDYWLGQELAAGSELLERVS